MFKDRYKYYKARKPPPNLENVIDVINNPNENVKKINVRTNHKKDIEVIFGLKSIKEWHVYEFINIPGLILLQNPFTAKGQQEWILKCLKQYTRKPSILNIDAHNLLQNNETWWDACFGAIPKNDLSSKLRWATLGYHHNWNSKLYSEDLKSKFPEDLKDLIETIAKVLNFHEFKAEAAIINYYKMKSTLAGHTDHSEIHLDAPLFSISFGQSAIFLIGGFKQEDPAHAIYLRSGDVLVMSGSSRLKYHGVPKILFDKFEPWAVSKNCVLNNEVWLKVQKYISESRINLNVRQVLKPGQLNLQQGLS